MTTFGMTITGVKEIQKKFERLEKKDSRKIVRKEAREAQKTVMLPAVKSNATAMIGGSMGSAIAKKLTVRAMTKMKRGSFGSKVVIKEDEQFVHISADGVRSYIPNAIEFGHAAANNKGGTKITKPIPFKRKAFEEKRRALANKFATETVRAIERAVKL
jgi:hypothetical protein